MNDGVQKFIATHRLRMLFDGREIVLLALLLLIVSSGAALFLYHIDRHSFLYFGDAASHIVRARQFIDSQRPGFENIGTVWLPLPHLLLIPFVSIDILFYSGIAGLFIGIPCLIGTSVLLFLIIRRIIPSSEIAFIAACLFGLNPSIVYMAMTPMSEPSLLFFAALTGYGLVRWMQSRSERWLLMSAAAIILASLCRYEAWLMVPFVSIVAIYNGVTSWTRQRKALALRSLLISGICWMGIAFWLIWNKIQYGDPMKFAHWTLAVGTSPLTSVSHADLSELIFTLGSALLTIFGPLIFIVSAFAFIPLRSFVAEKNRASVLVLFALPSIFTLTALLWGFVQVDRWGLNWRFVVISGLFLSIAGALGLNEIFRRIRSGIVRGAIVLSLFAVFIIQLALPVWGVGTFNEARKSFNYGPKDAAEIGEELHLRYDNGAVALVTGYGQGQRIMISSGLPLKIFHIIYDSGEPDIIGSIRESERFLVIGKDKTPESAKFVDYWLTRRMDLLQFYTIQIETPHYLLLKRLR